MTSVKSNSVFNKVRSSCDNETKLQNLIKLINGMGVCVEYALHNLSIAIHIRHKPITHPSIKQRYESRFSTYKSHDRLRERN